MIDIRKLKELVRLMVTNELTELDLRDSDEQVTLRRQGPGQGGGVALAPAPVAVAAPVAAPVDPAANGTPAAPPAEAAADNLLRIESPMVGTYYSAANPDAKPFISVGDQVSAESPVCIIEAMKIFNEIKAECAGTVRQVLVKNGDAVEFGQPLFLVEPS